MPTYTYRCNTCDTIHEAVYSMKDVPQSEPCTACHGLAYKIITLEQCNFDTHSKGFVGPDIKNSRGSNSFKGKTYIPPQKVFTGN